MSTLQGLYKSLRAVWNATPELLVFSPDLYFGERPKPSMYPSVVMTQTARKDVYNTGPGYWQDCHVQFALYTSDLTSVDDFDKALNAAYNFQKPYIDNAYVMVIRREGELLVPQDVRTPDGNVVWLHAVTFFIQLGKNRDGSSQPPPSGRPHRPFGWLWRYWP